MKALRKHRFFIIRFGGPRVHSRPSRPSTLSWLDFSRFLRPPPQRDQIQWWWWGRWAGQRWRFAGEKWRLKVWWTWWCGIALRRQPMCVLCVSVCHVCWPHTHIHKQTHTHIILCVCVWKLADAHMYIHRHNSMYNVDVHVIFLGATHTHTHSAWVHCNVPLPQNKKKVG